MKKSKLCELVDQEISKLLKEMEYDSGKGTISYDNEKSYKKLDTSHYVNSIRKNIVEDLHLSLETANKMFSCTDPENRRNKPQRIKFTPKDLERPGLYLLDVADVNELLKQIHNRVALKDFKKSMTMLIESIVQKITASSGTFTTNKYNDYKLNLKRDQKMYATFTMDAIPPCDFYVRFTKVKTYKNGSRDNFMQLRKVLGSDGQAGVRKFVQEKFLREAIDEDLKKIDQYLGSIIEKKEDKKVIAKNKAAADKRAEQEEIKERFKKLKAKIERSKTVAEEDEKSAQQNADGVANPGQMRSFRAGHYRFVFIRSFAFAVSGQIAHAEKYGKNRAKYFKGLKPKDLIPLWDELLTKGERIASKSKEKFRGTDLEISHGTSAFIEIGDETVNMHAIEKHIKETSAKHEESSEEKGESDQDTPDWSQRQNKALGITINNPTDIDAYYPDDIPSLKQWLYRKYFKIKQSSGAPEDQNESLSPIQKYILKEQDQDETPELPPPPPQYLGQDLTDEQLEEAIKAIQKMLEMEVTGIYDIGTHKAWADKNYKVPTGPSPAEEPAAEEERSSVEPVDSKKFAKAKEKMNEEYFKKLSDKGMRLPGAMYALAEWLEQISHFTELLSGFKSNISDSTPLGDMGKTLTPEIFNAIMKLQERLGFGERDRDGVYGTGTHRKVVQEIKKKYYPQAVKTLRNNNNLAKAIVLQIYANTKEAAQAHGADSGNSESMSAIVDRKFNRVFPEGTGTKSTPAFVAGHGIDINKIISDTIYDPDDDPKNLTSFLANDFFYVELIEEKKHIRATMWKVIKDDGHSITAQPTVVKRISKGTLIKTWNSIKESLMTQTPASQGEKITPSVSNQGDPAPKVDLSTISSPQTINSLVDEYFELAKKVLPSKREESRVRYNLKQLFEQDDKTRLAGLRKSIISKFSSKVINYGEITNAMDRLDTLIKSKNWDRARDLIDGLKKVYRSKYKETQDAVKNKLKPKSPGETIRIINKYLQLRDDNVEGKNHSEITDEALPALKDLLNRAKISSDTFSAWLELYDRHEDKRAKSKTVKDLAVDINKALNNKNTLQPKSKSDSTKADPISRDLVEKICKLYIELKETRDTAKQQDVSLFKIPKVDKESWSLMRDKYWKIVNRIMAARKELLSVPRGNSIFKDRYIDPERHNSARGKFAPIFHAYDGWVKSGNKPIPGLKTETLKKAFDS